MNNWIVLGLLAWGVLALGASKPWGYIPLLAGMATYGVIAIGVSQPGPSTGRGIGVSLAMFCGAVLAQVIPLPAAVVGLISPSLTDVIGYRTSVAPISVDPDRTALGLCFVIALSLFFAGLAKTLQRDAVRRLVAGIAGLGVIVALVGLAEARTSWPGMYAMAGLPTPPDSPPFGPFSSKNHYAGWMLMAVAITGAYLGALLDRVGRSIPHDAVVSTGGIVLLQCAVTVMALALVQTQSRAGILGLGLIMFVIAARLIRRQADVKSRVVLAAPFVVLPLVGILVAGTPAIVTRFSAHSWSTAHGRLPIWEQGITMARDFPITGAGLNTYQRMARLYPASGFEPYEGAHNDFLQLAIEGGLLVGIPAVILIGFFISKTHQRFRESAGDGTTQWIRLGAVVGLVAISAQELVEFSLQIPGNAALFVVLAAIAIHRDPQALETQPRPRWS